MTTAIFLKVYETDLGKLKEEIVAYTDETLIWKTADGISNSAGNLCLHLVGNVNHFIGATLGNTGYVRQRDKEFSDKNIPKAELIKMIEEASQTVKNTLTGLTDADLDKNYPILFQGKENTTAHMLVFFYGHFNYHLGQINYHRRLVK